MEEYHHVWLESHPHRSDEWLAAKLREGFDIHHVDGNHSNNDPRNLVLIEHSDHFALHNGGTPHIKRQRQHQRDERPVKYIRYKPRKAVLTKRRAITEYENTKLALIRRCGEQP